MQTYDPSTIQPEGRESEISREEISVPSQPCESEGGSASPKGARQEARIILPINDKDKIRFWNSIANHESENGCLEWTGSRNEQGYGHFYVHKKNFRAHRIAYFLEFNVDPGDFFILHSCDIPSCVNPYHLNIGTHKDNMRDMAEKGRGNQPRGDNHPSRTKPERVVRGSAHGCAKLTEGQVCEIRSLRDSGVILRIIAARYGVTAAAISFIARRKGWKHLNPPTAD